MNAFPAGSEDGCIMSFCSFPLFFLFGAALQRINQRFFILDLETEAGTYVKEFVHGVYVCT
jgi:hypothetical protein